MVNELNFFKKEKKDIFKKEKNIFKENKIKIKNNDFTPERTLKIAGSMVFLGVGVHLLKDIIN